MLTYTIPGQLKQAGTWGGLHGHEPMLTTGSAGGVRRRCSGLHQLGCGTPQTPAPLLFSWGKGFSFPPASASCVSPVLLPLSIPSLTTVKSLAASPLSPQVLPVMLMGACKAIAPPR